MKKFYDLLVIFPLQRAKMVIKSKKNEPCNRSSI